METPDRVGIAGTPGRGPYVALYLRLAGDVISEAQFQTHGCGVSIACGSMLTGRRRTCSANLADTERVVCTRSSNPCVSSKL
jgi:hypothetical protein